MKKDDAERAVRSLAVDWRREVGAASKDDFSVSAFKDWAQAKGYGHYLVFRTTTGVSDDIERWLADALGQRWRY